MENYEYKVNIIRIIMMVKHGGWRQFWSKFVFHLRRTLTRNLILPRVDAGTVAKKDWRYPYTIAIKLNLGLSATIGTTLVYILQLFSRRQQDGII